jgi:hypothetical protein
VARAVHQPQLHVGAAADCSLLWVVIIESQGEGPTPKSLQSALGAPSYFEVSTTRKPVHPVAFGKIRVRMVQRT